MNFNNSAYFTDGEKTGELVFFGCPQPPSGYHASTVIPFSCIYFTTSFSW